MKLDSREVEGIEKARKMLKGIVVLVIDSGKVRQVSTVEKKASEKEFQTVDKIKRKI